MPSPRRLTSWLAAVFVSVAIGGGVARAQSPVPESQLETFLGLGQGDLTGLNNGPVTSGSAIMQSVTVSAGATLTFDFDFLTNAPPPGSGSGGLLGALDPFAFITRPTLTDFADNYYTYPSPLPAAPSQTGYLYQTGYRSDTVTFTAAGTYMLGFGIANVTTDSYGSALLLDNLTLTGGTLLNGSFATGDFSNWSTIGSTGIETASFGVAPTNGTYQALIYTTGVPEPSSPVLLVLGSLGAAAACRWHRKSLSSCPSA